MSTGFARALADRAAADYADFLLPHLEPGFCVLDVGCGSGTITLGLARTVREVVGVDPDDEFDDARRYAEQHNLANVDFQVGDVYALGFPTDHFDACLCHSMLETLDRPLDGLVEIRRVLKPGGVVGVASVEYGGLIVAGPESEQLERFYAIREQLWLLENAGDPYRGRELRGLMERAGFERVTAMSKYFCYGTRREVEAFGLARADDCQDPWYSESAKKHGLATHDDLVALSQAWREWSVSPDAYAAFAWCRAVGWAARRG